MTVPRDSYDRAAYLRAVVFHRCGDVLSADDLASIEARLPPAEMLPVEIGEQIMDVITAMEAKLDEIAETISERGRRTMTTDDALDRRAQMILDAVRQCWQLLSDLEIVDRMNRVEY